MSEYVPTTHDVDPCEVARTRAEAALAEAHDALRRASLAMTADAPAYVLALLRYREASARRVLVEIVARRIEGG